jgi:hypothetical protein
MKTRTAPRHSTSNGTATKPAPVHPATNGVVSAVELQDLQIDLARAALEAVLPGLGEYLHGAAAKKHVPAKFDLPVEQRKKLIDQMSRLAMNAVWPEQAPQLPWHKDTGRKFDEEGGEIHYEPKEAARIARFIGRSVAGFLCDLDDTLDEIGAMFLAVDGKDQLGLYDLRSACIELRDARVRLLKANTNLRVRGQKSDTTE